jgi:hypothetical protein
MDIEIMLRRQELFREILKYRSLGEDVDAGGCDLYRNRAAARAKSPLTHGTGAHMKFEISAKSSNLPRPPDPGPNPTAVPTER